MADFDFEKDYVFEDAFLKIIPLKPNHTDEYSEIADDPEVWTYFLEKGLGRNHLEKYIAEAIEQRQKKKQYPFAIKEKSQNQFVGMTRLYEIDHNLKTIKMGHTWLGKKYWGRGINQRCKYLLFQFIFDHLQFERVGFGVSAENTRSLKALENMGCIKEGKLRAFLNKTNSNERIDLILLSILKNEWDQSIKHNLQLKLSSKII
ncbi:MAG: GNAT family protein [Bacteroidota bacterium]